MWQSNFKCKEHWAEKVIEFGRDFFAIKLINKVSRRATKRTTQEIITTVGHRQTLCYVLLLQIFVVWH